ncbi:MAG: hypothetical protein U0807_09620 [Candidatus Binatia bacterium]
MARCVVRTLVAVIALAGAAALAHADRQAIATGHGSQTSVVADAGPNGVCETAAPPTDIQSLAVGTSEPNRVVVECGADRVVSTTAGGDDVQLVAVGDGCNNANVDVIDSGANGIAESTAAGDDQQVIPPGQGTPNAACIRSGANGLADVADPLGGDDVRLVPVGRAEPNAAVIRCGTNAVAETFANNAIAGGDDVQLIAAGGGCNNASSVVVDAGANGIAETRAQGVDLMVLSAARVVRFAIPKRRQLASRRIKVAVVNREFGSAAPPSRSFALTANDSGCPSAMRVDLDADARTPGAQPTAAVGQRGRTKGSVLVTLAVGDVTTPERDTPMRCALAIGVTSTDTTPSVDDASNTGNNTTRVELEVVDANDL